MEPPGCPGPAPAAAPRAPVGAALGEAARDRRGQLVSGRVVRWGIRPRLCRGWEVLVLLGRAAKGSLLPGKSRSLPQMSKRTRITEGLPWHGEG